MDIIYTKKTTMETTLVDTKVEKFSCSKCGNTEFDQECFIKSYEIVNIIKTDDKLSILSLDMHEVKEEDIEHNNEFLCPKCNAKYTIGKKDNIDTVFDIGEGL